MEESNVESRLDTLEEQVSRILGIINDANSQKPKVKDWRRSLGLFNGHAVMEQIDEQGQQIRQQDREQTANDHS